MLEEECRDWMESIKMISINRLFDNRIASGKALEEYIDKNGITRTPFSKESGVSRPTLNRLFQGDVTSRTIFIAHMRRILAVLDIFLETLLSAENGLISPLDGPEGLFLECVTSDGKKAFFRASVGIYDEESGEVIWTPVTKVEGYSRQDRREKRRSAYPRFSLGRKR